MTEAEARLWLEQRFDSTSLTRLERFVEMVLREAAEQNLIAASTIDHLWARHIVDSAQLIPLARTAGPGDWIDIGSGAGFPGIVAAILQPRRVLLVEPRRRRVAFLEKVVAHLSLDATVAMTKVEQLPSPSKPAAIISARAVGSLPELIGSALHCSDIRTLWLLPKGRRAREEVALAREAWQGVFHVEQSVTASDSAIVVAHGVRRQ